MISSDRVELLYRRREDALVNFLGSRARPAAAIVVALFVAYLARAFHRTYKSGHEYLRTGALPSMVTLRHAIIPLIVLSLGFAFVSERYQRAYRIFCMLLVWMLSAYLLFRGAEFTLRYIVLFFTPLFLISGFLFLSRIDDVQRKKTALVVFSALYGIAVITISALLFRNAEAYLGYFWGIKTHITWISIMILAFQREDKTKARNLVFNPLSGLHAVYWPVGFQPIEGDETKRNEFWWRGILNLLLGYTLLLLRLKLETMSLAWGNDRILWAPRFYLFMLISETGTFNILAGVVRLWGFQIRDATNFVFLAHRPAEFWRRSNVYNYLFILHYVYFPLTRIIKSRPLVTLIAFSYFFANHYGLWAFVADGGNAAGFNLHFPISSLPTTMTIPFFIMSFALLYGTQKHWFYGYSARQKPLISWLSVAANHIVWILLFYCLRWVNFWLTR